MNEQFKKWLEDETMGTATKAEKEIAEKAWNAALENAVEQAFIFNVFDGDYSDPISAFYSEEKAKKFILKNNKTSRYGLCIVKTMLNRTEPYDWMNR